MSLYKQNSNKRYMSQFAGLGELSSVDYGKIGFAKNVMNTIYSNETTSYDQYSINFNLKPSYGLSSVSSVRSIVLK